MDLSLKVASYHGLYPRSDSIKILLDNYLPYFQYFATAQIGTPPQILELAVSLKHGATWLNTISACSKDRCEGGSFNNSASDTCVTSTRNFALNDSAFNSMVYGSYITDVVSFGNATVQDLTMALATDGAISPTGILGLGLDLDQGLLMSGNAQYNIMEQLMAQGLIKAKAFALYLGSQAAPGGTLLFGAYDTAKYSGDLIMMPLLKNSLTGVVDSFKVAWTSVSVSFEQASYNYPLPTLWIAEIIIDISSPCTYLGNINNQTSDFLFQMFGAYGSEFNISCDAKEDYVGFISFGFGGPGGPVIPVPYSEMFIPVYNEDGTKADHCVLGIQSTDGPTVFGQSVLRSAYALFDLENLMLGLAPVNWDSEDSNIVEYGEYTFQTLIASDTSEPTGPATSRPVTDLFTSYSSIYAPSEVLPTSEPSTLSPFTTITSQASMTPRATTTSGQKYSVVTLAPGPTLASDAAKAMKMNFRGALALPAIMALTVGGLVGWWFSWMQ